MESASLERVESGLALGLQFGGLGGVLPHDEQARDQAEDEGEDCEDHKLNSASRDCVNSATDGKQNFARIN